jgi:SAM-dependent methyltransferase
MPQITTICDEHSKFENDAQISRLHDLIDDAREIGCEAALQKHNHNIDYLTDERRARYLEIINIQDHEHVLEIGSSMGQHTRLIAKRCRRIEAIEVVADQAEFAALWCQQSGLHNVNFTAGGAAGTLPYADAAFDVVIMNYVLEWSAGREIARADEFHLRLIKEARRVLKPSGRLFVSTKNRFGLRLLLGSVDEHLGIRFGNALPRPIAHALSSRVSRDIPRGYLHSRRGLENLLFAAGFSKVDAFLSFPDARWPDIILPFDRKSLTRLGELGRSRYSKKDQLFLLLPAFLQQWLATSHTFIAR